MDLYCEFYDRRQGLEIWRLHLIVILTYTDGWRLAIVLPDKQMYNTIIFIVAPCILKIH
jgi:hypothetical protein